VAFFVFVENLRRCFVYGERFVGTAIRLDLVSCEQSEVARGDSCFAINAVPHTGESALLQPLWKRSCGGSDDGLSASAVESASIFAFWEFFWLALSALDGLMGVASYIVANTVFSLDNHPGRPAFLHPLLSFYRNLGGHKSLRRICHRLGSDTTRVLGPHARGGARVSFAVFNVPFGTALGIYTLWVLRLPNPMWSMRRKCEAPARLSEPDDALTPTAPRVKKVSALERIPGHSEERSDEESWFSGLANNPDPSLRSG